MAAAYAEPLKRVGSIEDPVHRSIVSVVREETAGFYAQTDTYILSEKNDNRYTAVPCYGLVALPSLQHFHEAHTLG